MGNTRIAISTVIVLAVAIFGLVSTMVSVKADEGDRPPGVVQFQIGCLLPTSTFDGLFALAVAGQGEDWQRWAYEISADPESPIEITGDFQFEEIPIAVSIAVYKERSQAGTPVLLMGAELDVERAEGTILGVVEGTEVLWDQNDDCDIFQFQVFLPVPAGFGSGRTRVINITIEDPTPKKIADGPEPSSANTIPAQTDATAVFDAEDSGLNAGGEDSTFVLTRPVITPAPSLEAQTDSAITSINSDSGEGATVTITTPTLQAPDKIQVAYPAAPDPQENIDWDFGETGELQDSVLAELFEGTRTEAVASQGQSPSGATDLNPVTPSLSTPETPSATPSAHAVVVIEVLNATTKEPIPAVHVSVLSSRVDATYSRQTDPAGVVELVLPTGNYTVEADAGEFTGVEMDLKVATPGPNRLLIELQGKGPSGPLTLTSYLGLLMGAVGAGTVGYTGFQAWLMLRRRSVLGIADRKSGPREYVRRLIQLPYRVRKMIFGA